jgi:single-stranded DNA-binding protein
LRTYSQAVATFRVASTPRYLDKASNEWKDGEGLFLSCNVWRQAAEKVAESLHGAQAASPAPGSFLCGD